MAADAISLATTPDLTRSASDLLTEPPRTPAASRSQSSSSVVRFANLNGSASSLAPSSAMDHTTSAVSSTATSQRRLWRFPSSSSRGKPFRQFSRKSDKGDATARAESVSQSEQSLKDEQEARSIASAKTLDQLGYPDEVRRAFVLSRPCRAVL